MTKTSFGISCGALTSAAVATGCFRKWIRAVGYC